MDVWFTGICRKYASFHTTITASEDDGDRTLPMQNLACSCGNALFFENSACLRCGSEVGFDYDQLRMVAIGPSTGHLCCQNGLDHAACNWTVREDADSPFCESCQLNQVIPDLSIESNVIAWRRMEAAKRRVLYTLTAVGLRPKKYSAGPGGLAFLFLSPDAGAPVITGHAGGTITLNLMEADDSYREAERVKLGEPYRTLIGHFRHETGHYYWDQIFARRESNDPLLTEYRALFGDESTDYAGALARYYQQGPITDWTVNHITAYASAHPWEDWAETWAQYLHIVEGNESAHSYGFAASKIAIPFTPFEAKDIFPEVKEDVYEDFLEKLNEWSRLAPALNEMAASLGHPTLYPFTLSAATIRKIHFVHKAIQQHLSADSQSEAKEDDAPPACLVRAVG